MNLKKIIKVSLISVAILGITGSSFNNMTVNAKHRHTRSHYTYSRHGHKKAKRHLRKCHKRWIYQAKRSHAKKHHHVIRTYVRASKVRKLHTGGYGYVLNTFIPGHQFLDNGYGTITANPLDPENTASTAEIGAKVRIVGSKKINHKLFYAIESDTTAQNDLSDGWIYSGALGLTPKSRAHTIDMQAFENNTDNSNSQNITTPSNDTTSYPYRITNREKAAKQQTIKDINNDRNSVGCAPLTESQELDQIAQMRSHQIMNNYAHLDPSTGLYYYYEDAQQLGDSDINNNNLAENAGFETSELHYTPKHAANDLNIQMFNDEASSNGGHYRNITDPQLNRVGVGATYRKSDNSYWIVEDFGY